MFKKLSWILFALSFASFVLFVSFYGITVDAKPSWAAATLTVVTTAVTPTITPTPKVDYYLAYPGLLPDHPLYKIKAVRDKVWLFFTRDSFKRAEVMLLFADKRIGAGKVLVEGNKVPLGITTFQKGEKYLESVFSEVATAKEKGADVSTFVSKMKDASLKYEEILIDLQGKVSSEGKQEIENLLKFLKSIQEKINTL